MLQIPKELDESAYLDGASHFQIWWHVILPLCRPALATMTVMLFIGVWNSLQQPLIYLQSASLFTLPVFVNLLINPTANTQPWPMIMASSVLTTLPLIVVFLFTQRYMLESIVLSGGKG
jgi:ABC-type glycerol-3-phosphate transport system permease component